MRNSLPGAVICGMAPLRSIAAAVSALILCLGVAVAGEVSDSIYTRHDYERCTRTSDDDPIMERRCQGHDGIAVHWTNEPDNSSVSFGSEIRSAASLTRASPSPPSAT
jgi:hypothetical protein